MARPRRFERPTPAFGGQIVGHVTCGAAASVLYPAGGTVPRLSRACWRQSWPIKRCTPPDRADRRLHSRVGCAVVAWQTGALVRMAHCRLHVLLSPHLGTLAAEAGSPASSAVVTRP